MGGSAALLKRGQRKRQLEGEVAQVDRTASRLTISLRLRLSSRRQTGR